MTSPCIILTNFQICNIKVVSFSPLTEFSGQLFMCLTQLRAAVPLAATRPRPVVVRSFDERRELSLVRWVPHRCRRLVPYQHEVVPVSIVRFSINILDNFMKMYFCSTLVFVLTISDHWYERDNIFYKLIFCHS